MSLVPRLRNPGPGFPTRNRSLEEIFEPLVLFYSPIRMASLLLSHVCAQSSPTLCDPMDCSPPGSCVHGILQAILEWVAMSSSKGSSRPGMEPTSLMSPAMAGGFFVSSTTWEAHPVNTSCQIHFSSLRREIGSLVLLYLVHKHTFQFCHL